MRSRPLSTTQRVITTLTIAVTGVLVVTGVVGLLVLNRYVEDRVFSRLADTSGRIQASLVGLHDFQIDRRTAENMAVAGGATVIVLDGTDPVMWLNGDAGTARQVAGSTPRDGSPHRVPDRSDLVAVWLDVSGSGLTVTDGTRVVAPTGLMVAVPTDREAATMRTITSVVVVGIVLAIVTLVALTDVVVRRGLRPLQEMSERAQAYAGGDRAVRLPEEGGDADMTRLATTLNHALDAQRDSEQRLRAFVADASHELRTPLTTATGWVELYLQGGLTDPGRRDHAMQRVLAQLGRMRVLADELALLARLDRARPLSIEDVDLARLTTEVVEDARVVNPDRAFTVRAGGPAPLRADGLRLQQVVVNLVGNAVQHTPDGTPVEVTVTPAPSRSSSQPMHTLLVTDHGPGIAPQDQPHIFERFWRKDGSRHRQLGGSGGSGLGLAIVASIVAAHGGYSDVISAPGQGTTIRVRLPLVADGLTPADPR